MGYSTKEAARKIGVVLPALYSYLRREVIKSPLRLPGSNILIWTGADVAEARRILEARRQPSDPTTSA